MHKILQHSATGPLPSIISSRSHVDHVAVLFHQGKTQRIEPGTAAFPTFPATLKNYCLFTSFSLYQSLPAQPKSALIFLELPMWQKHAEASFTANKAFQPFGVKNPRIPLSVCRVKTPVSINAQHAQPNNFRFVFVFVICVLCYTALLSVQVSDLTCR